MASIFTSVKSGNWRAPDTWDIGSGYPGGTASAVITGGHTVTMQESNACGQLQTSGTGTAVLNCAGYNLAVSGATTIAAAGLTLQNWGSTALAAVNINAAVTLTLGGNLTCTTLTKNSTGTGTIACGTSTFTCTTSSISGSLTFTGSGQLSLGAVTMAGITLTLSAATSMASLALSSSGTIATAGNNITISGNVTLTAGPLTMTGTGTVSCVDLNIGSSSARTLTMAANWTLSGSLILNGAAVVSGAFNMQAKTLRLKNNSTTTAFSLTFPAGRTLAITGASCAITLLANSDQTVALLSGTGSSPFTLSYAGTPGNLVMARVACTDVNYSSTTSPCFNWAGGTLTRCTGIANRNIADLQNIIGTIT